MNKRNILNKLVKIIDGRKQVGHGVVLKKWVGLAECLHCRYIAESR